MSLMMVKTRQMVDLGSRVIKIDRTGLGDFVRAYDAHVKGHVSHFVWTNRSKVLLIAEVGRVGLLLMP